ncbi:avidin-like [Ahaetulla prasina]|uniref:avidin-like n=1 Tax=Ahaetulla prasina TaxID=499056 RepID=UPI002648D56E|nr:avidin-like [Ahaetulla prasina]
MAIGTALLGLLAFLLGCSGTSAKPQNSERFAMRKCVLAGNWVNDQGSKMVISDSNNSGVFSGSYLTAMAATDNIIRPSPLQGVQHQVDQRAQPTFGFTVNWSFAESTTVFAGQCFLDEDGEEQLKTTWLLRAEVGSVAEDWGATRVGTDTFYRTK